MTEPLTPTRPRWTPPAPTIREISYCRVCGHTELTPLHHFGEQYVSDFVDKEDIHRGIKAPLELVLCEHCSLVQLRHTAPQEILYSRHYWYRSGVTDTMRSALRDVTRAAEQLVDLEWGDIVLDIGSNDGTLLRSYEKDNLTKVGVEPATNLIDAGSQGVDVFISDFWSWETYTARLGSRKAKVITACGMFYDLDDPNQFIRDVSRALDADGLFIAQLMCLRNMLDANDLGNLAHEHLEFYTLESLHTLFGNHGLEICDIEMNSVNGESYRLYVRKFGSKLRPREGAIARLSAATVAESKLCNPEFYKSFFAKMERNKEKVVAFIRDAVACGKKVWVYGASTKGNVILQYYGLDHSHIEGAADRSPEKWGKYTIGTGIPIHSEMDARAANPDYFLVLPYAFLQEFINREAEWQAKGGRFIVPLPEFRLV